MTKQIRIGMRISALLLLLFSLMPSLGYAETLYVVNSQSRTLSKIDTSTDAVDNGFAALGNVPNKIVVDLDYIWAVNSGDNAVQKISRSTGATHANILVGIGSNPWDAVLHQGNLYVTGLFTGKVYRVNTGSGTVTGSVNVGTAPEALCVIGDKLYVSNAGNYMQNYAGSSVSVIDINSFSLLTTIPVMANPQYLASYNGKLHVSCTGNWTDIGGAICIIDTADDTLVHTIDVGGTPGCIWISGAERAYVADSNGAHLFSYNPQTYELYNGVGNPLSNGGSEIVGNGSMIAILSPNWSGNGTVKVLHPDLSPWKQYTVALMPTDLKLGVEATSVQESLLPSVSIIMYPNPVREGGKLALSRTQSMNSMLSIYNVKGQKVAEYPFIGSSLEIANPGLGSGVYFYRVYSPNTTSGTTTGRFAVVR